MSRRLPWVKHWPTDWLGRELRYSMNLAERGMYRDLLDYCHAEGSIPTDSAVLQRLLSVGSAEFEAAWPRVSKEFTKDPSNPNRLVNEEVSRIASETKKFSRTQAEKGKKGGRPKAEKKPEDSQLKANGKPNQTRTKAGRKPSEPEGLVTSWGERRADL